ncbi:MAG: CRTAC1 family protein, partial [Aeoliella sp.]
MSQAPHAQQTAESVDRYQAGWAALSQLLREGKSFSGRERNCAFLNTGGPKFANAAAACGLDFPDDARALAVVDWDQDGDLDLWITNRTAPRLRLMRNEMQSEASQENFVSFRLQGVHCNADGIGGRVMVRLKNSPQAPLQQTLYAGDAFLSQSSKWLHFGIPAGSELEQVAVRWPGGSEEIFRGVEASHRYLLKQGTRSAQHVAPRAEPMQFATGPVAPPPRDSTARTVLVSRPPLPLFTYRHLDSHAIRTVEVDQRPLLITFWSHSCA